MTDQLDLQKTYRAILDAARGRRFISYGALAKANDTEWNKVHRKMNRHLGKLVEFAVENDWPMLSAIVVRQNNIDNGHMDGETRTGFITCARELGFDIGDETAFIEEQQQAVFSWAQNAPDELEINEDGGADEPTPSEDSTSDLFDDPDRQFWFVGASWGGVDQTERFISDGIWQNGHGKEKYSELVARIKPGDRIAIKSKFKRKNNLPFDNQNIDVSGLYIKAIGTVTKAAEDGRTIKVGWQSFEQSKIWYFYTGRYHGTINEAVASNDRARRLIKFAFGDDEQDIKFWLSQPYWDKRYRTSKTTPAHSLDDQEATDTDGEEVEFTPYVISDILNDGCFLSEEDLNSALSNLHEKKNLILQGPPGTGKTWLAKRLGYTLIGTKDSEITRKRMRAIQFHPSLSYEDFIRGWRPDSDGRLSLIDGIFLEAVKAARAEPDRPFVLVIEEINRGNPAQIFGEILTLLEKDKRNEDEAIELAYRHSEGERIFVPENLYVVGTMNIADRSLALVDFAFRRRFAFVSLEPVFDEKWLKWCEESGMDKEILSRIQERMIKLNKEIAEDRALGEQFKIGHSYVTPARDEQVTDTRTWFTEIVKTEIAPLLEEYWFDNHDKVTSSKNSLLDL